MAPHRLPSSTLRLGVVVLLTAALLAVAWIALPGGADARSQRAAKGKIGLGANQALGARKKRACVNERLARRLARRSAALRRVSSQRQRKAKRARASRNVGCNGATASADPSSLYWGAWIGSQHTGTEAPWDMNATADFEAEAGKPLSLIHFSSPFADCSQNPCAEYSFPTKPMETIRSHGAIPFFSWSSQSTPSSLSEPDYQLSDVASGRYDAYIRKFAAEAAAWGQPFFLRFDWEMNGNWFPWAEGVNGNGEGEYVQAWRHVHDLFAQAGATNATWVWCPNVDPKGEFRDVGAFYPGDAYVDWTCLDGYNWGGNRWTSFSDLFGPTYHRIVDEIAPDKPMIIAEVGCSEHGGSKSRWISEMLQQLPTAFPRVHGVMWFDKFQENDWPLQTSAAAEAAFASGIQSPSYLTNAFGSLPPGKIPVPS